MTLSQPPTTESIAAADERRAIRDLIRFANAIIRQALLVSISGFVFAGVMIGYVLATPRTYTASASFLLQPPKQGANLPGIAAQLGISLPTTDAAQSAPFYAEMIKSRVVLAALVDRSFRDQDSDGRPVTTTLADAFRVKGTSPALRRQHAIARLDRSLVVRISTKSNIVSFSVDAPTPTLAATVADTILGELVLFNTQRRQSQAAAERRFTERRLGDVGGELRAAEDALESFLRQNRSYTQSPQLRFQEERLTRTLDLKRTLYSNLAQSFEQAKIEEVRDTPQITVIERPEIPVEATSRLLIGKTLVAGLLGCIIGFLFGFLREQLVREERKAGTEIVEFARLRSRGIATARRLLTRGTNGPTPEA